MIRPWLGTLHVARYICLGSSISFAVLAAAFCQCACSQSSPVTRTFVLDGIHGNDPVKIIGFRVGGHVVDPGSRFQASEEAWLRDSTVIIQNLSSKEVMGIWVNVFFPEIDDGHAIAADQIQAGNRASSETHTLKRLPLHDNDYPAFTLAPGQTVDLPLGSHYDSTAAHRRSMKQGVEPSRCLVRFSAVYFRNGMKWSPNYFARPDPNHPGEFIEITPLEFWASKEVPND